MVLWEPRLERQDQRSTHTRVPRPTEPEGFKRVGMAKRDVQHAERAARPSKPYQPF